MPRFVPISRGGQAVTGEEDTGLSSDILAADNPDFVSFGDQGFIQRTSPLNRPALPEPEPIDPVTWLNSSPPTGNDHGSAREKERWNTAFRKQFPRGSVTAEEYVNIVQNLTDENGNLIDTTNIQDHVLKSAQAHKPRSVNRDIENKAETRRIDTEETRLAEKVREYNSDPLNIKRGFGLSPTGKEFKVDPNVDFKRKQEISKGMSDRLKSLESQRPDRKNYRDGQTFDKAGYNEDFTTWRDIYNQERELYLASLGKMNQEDDATSVGESGVTTEDARSAITATNPSTGERIQSFDGGATWEPVQ